MSHAERHPGINQRTVAPERTTAPATTPPETAGRTTGGDLDPKDPNFFRKHWKALAAGATALLAAGGVVYAVGTGIKGEAPAQPGPVPAQPGEQPGNEGEPGTGEQPAGEQYTVEALRLPENLSAGELGKLIVVDRLDGWTKAGTGPELADEWLLYNGTMEAFATEVAERHREAFAVALYGENYKDNPNSAARVEASVKANIGFIVAYLSTIYNENSEVTYDANNFVDPANVQETISGNTRILTVPFTFSSNVAETGGVVNEISAPSGTYTLTIENGIITNTVISHG